jgi:hypothetical protein
MPYPNLGSRTMLNRRWAPGCVISGLEAPAEQYLLDPSLPILGHDPSLFNNDDTVIPQGRFLGVLNSQTATVAAYANTSRPILTLANGSEGLVNGSGVSTDVRALGFSETVWFQEKPMTSQPKSFMTKHKLIQVPYIQASNGAYGALKPGDAVTAYYGSATTTTPIPNEVGKVVKWISKKVFSSPTQAASTTVSLPAATLPSFRPTVIQAQNGTTFVTITSAVYSYVGTSWQVVVNSAVTNVLYSYGQDADNIAGHVSSFEAVGTAGGQLSTSHSWDGWLQWVTDDWKQYPFPPLTTPRPFTSVVGEVPSQITTNSFLLAHLPLVPTRPINVHVTGTLIDPILGTSSNLTGAPMPLATDTFFTDYTFGLDYEINPITGQLTFTSNVTVTAVTVDYTYENSYADGRLYDTGQYGLTDGAYSGQRGTPANLEMFGVIAAMRIFTI